MKLLKAASLCMLLGLSSATAKNINIDITSGLDLGTGYISTDIKDNQNITTIVQNTYNIGFNTYTSFGRRNKLRIGLGADIKIPMSETKTNNTYTLDNFKSINVSFGYSFNKSFTLYTQGNYASQTLKNNSNEITFLGSGYSYGCEITLKKYNILNIAFSEYSMSANNSNLELDNQIVSITYGFRF